MWLSEKFKLNPIVSYLTTKNTKITKENQNKWTSALRVRRGYKCMT